MRPAFSLIELLLVVAIIAIISGAGSIFYSRFLTQNLVDNSTDKIVQSLRKAQGYALQSRKSESLGWGVTYVSGQIVLYLGNSYSGRTAIWDEISEIEGNVTITPFEVNFARLTGKPDAPGTITISGNSQNKSVSVNEQGMIGRI